MANSERDQVDQHMSKILPRANQMVGLTRTVHFMDIKSFILLLDQHWNICPRLNKDSDAIDMVPDL